MQYLKCTHVDAITRVGVNIEPASNGPDMPAIDGLEFAFANESQYPTPVPHFYCTAPDDAEVDVPGVLAVLTQAEFEAASDAELQARKDQSKQRATDYRWQVETGGIAFAGASIATGVDDQNRITSVIANAELAGVESVDFKASSGWVTLTLPEVKAVAAAIALHVQNSFSRERALHEAIDAAQDFAALTAVDIYSGWLGRSNNDDGASQGGV